VINELFNNLFGLASFVSPGKKQFTEENNFPIASQRGQYLDAEKTNPSLLPCCSYFGLG
jgi:hypothetical protein